MTAQYAAPSQQPSRLLLIRRRNATVYCEAAVSGVMGAPWAVVYAGAILRLARVPREMVLEQPFLCHVQVPLDVIRLPVLEDPVELIEQT